MAGPQTLSKMTTTLKLSRPDETLSTYKYILLWLVKLVIADPHLMLHVSSAQEWCGDGFCVVGSPAECAACWQVVTRLPGLCGCFCVRVGSVCAFIRDVIVILAHTHMYARCSVFLYVDNGFSMLVLFFFFSLTRLQIILDILHWNTHTCTCT